jgi:hypothetical protein
MSAIGGKKRESTGDFTKRVGLFEANVIAVNPTMEQLKEKLGIELKEDSKAAEYLGTSQDGNTYVRIDIWLKEVKDESLSPFKVSFFLEDKERENKDNTKRQYINSVGVCSWAADPNDLPDWFTTREYRVAYTGEEDLYSFMRTWLNELDYRSADTTLDLDWKKLMKGNVKDIKDQINGEWCAPVVALATVITKTKDDDTKEYQGVYNRGFLSPYSLRNFRLIDYSDQAVLDKLASKKPRDLKAHEKFVLQVTGQYGCKDFYILKDLKEYDADENMVSSDAAKIDNSADDGEY